MEDINEQYLNEFLEALQTSINQMSADGIRISYVPSKSMELGKYMANVLDEQWKELRGMEIQSVGIASISYDETSQELIKHAQQRRYDGRSFRKRRLCTKYHCRRSERRRNQFKWCHGRIYGNGIWHAEQRCVYGSSSATNMQQMQMNRQMQQGQQMPHGTGNGGFQGRQMGYGAANAGAQAVRPAQTANQPWICPACMWKTTGKF